MRNCIDVAMLHESNAQQFVKELGFEPDYGLFMTGKYFHWLLSQFSRDFRSVLKFESRDLRAVVLAVQVTCSAKTR